MPHLRLYVPEECLSDEFRLSTGFNAKKLLDHLVQVVAGYKMENPAIEKQRQEILSSNGKSEVAEEETRRDPQGNSIPPLVPMINLSNLKHAIVPLTDAHVGGDASKWFIHVTLAAGNDTPGRTAAVRLRASEVLGNAIDEFVGDLPGLASVTVHVQDIDRDRGYSTTAERKKKRSRLAPTT